MKTWYTPRLRILVISLVMVGISGSAWAQSVTPRTYSPAADEGGANIVAAGTCGPGAGNCCESNGSPGCDDVSCCEEVCFIDTYCCDVNWDSECAGFAAGFCDPSACTGGGCPGTGDCCDANGTGGCDDEICCAIVCSLDPFCCDTEWDTQCAGMANTECSDLCGNPGCSDAVGHCCLVHSAPGCDDDSCCEVVCSIIPECCDFAWTTDCAELAQEECGCTPPPAFPCAGGEGECCNTNVSPGCEDDCCCTTVCTYDPYCCESVWDSVCAEEALALCPGECQANAACPGGGDCLSAAASAGCEDEYCCNTICSLIPECCTEAWSLACVEAAAELCTCYEGGQLCPADAAGDCCDATDGSGCGDSQCCNEVCILDPFCCDVQWDNFCATSAIPQCGCAACGDGSVVWVTPEDNSVDARQPHPPDNAAMPQGLSLLFADAPASASDVICWDFCETEQNLELHAGVPPNGILDAIVGTSFLISVELQRPLTAGEVTRLTYTSGSGETVVTSSFVVHPGDVNGDGESNALDRDTIIDVLDFSVGLPISRADIDRNAELEPEDLLRLIDLLNGGGAYGVWDGVVVNDELACPQ